MNKRLPSICITVMAHDEERRIGLCLASLPLGRAGIVVHVVVNGSSDRTAALARAVAAVTDNVFVHEYGEGGKARSWNRFMFDDLPVLSRIHVFVDGDAEIAAGSIDALAEALERHPRANAASGLPLNGRSAALYREAMRRERGMFGDLYALRGAFLERMRGSGIRLPEDLIGDDGLIAALAKTDLSHEREWDDERIVVAEGAGFLCEPAALVRPRTLLVQYRRMINYSVRHFQNRIVSSIMRGPGPNALPRRLSTLYPEWLPTFSARRAPGLWLFDRAALARMGRAG